MASDIKFYCGNDPLRRLQAYLKNISRFMLEIKTIKISPLILEIRINLQLILFNMNDSLFLRLSLYDISQKDLFKASRKKEMKEL